MAVLDGMNPVDTWKAVDKIAGSRVMNMPHPMVVANHLCASIVMELARQGITWALPNLLLGSVVILPVWFLVYLFRPPRPRSD